MQLIFLGAQAIALRAQAIVLGGSPFTRLIRQPRNIPMLGVEQLDFTAPFGQLLLQGLDGTSQCHHLRGLVRGLLAASHLLHLDSQIARSRHPSRAAPAVECRSPFLADPTQRPSLRPVVVRQHRLLKPIRNLFQLTLLLEELLPQRSDGALQLLDLSVPQLAGQLLDLVVLL